MIRIIDSYTVRVLVACGMFEISRTNSGFMKLNDSETLRLAPDGPLEACLLVLAWASGGTS